VSSERLSRRGAAHVLFALVLVAIAVRLPQMKIPLGHVAGTVAYVGERWIEGHVPYRDVWDHRAPALYLVGGVLARKVAPLVARAEEVLVRALLGPEGAVVRIRPGEAVAETCRAAMMACGLATMFVVYAFVRQWTGRLEAAVAAGLCGFFSGTLVISGDCCEAMPPASLLVGVAFLAGLRSRGRRLAWLLAAGVATGAAVCFEPLAICYVVVLAAWAAGTSEDELRGVRRWVVSPAVVMAGALLPVAAFVSYFAWRDALLEMWRCVGVYNIRYRWHPLASWLPSTHARVLRALAPEQGVLWLFALGWAAHAFSLGFTRETRLVVIWGATALVAALIPRQMAPSDFLQTVPPVAVGAALAVTNPSEPLLQRDERGRLATRSIIQVLFIAALSLGLAWTEWRAFRHGASRERLSTARAAEKVADHIRSNTMPWHPVFVWGAYPEIYVLADRPAPFRLFNTRPLNVKRIVREYFGTRTLADLFDALAKALPPYIVATEGFLPDDLDRFGPGNVWSSFMKAHYVEERIIQSRRTDFVIYVRRDRARRR